MRRWFCVFALLYGFAGDLYPWTARSRTPVPIERRFEPRDGGRGAISTEAWWRVR